MKLGGNENSVVQNTFSTQSQSFKINACAQAFKILTDNLYEKKIPTIIRELSCNAWDSHIQAGNSDKPFDIFVPDMYEPEFYIRDYGTGLSEEDILNIYTTYFQSTKSDSNDYIGAFGLGSKTPLCYTDQFMLTSWFQGFEYQFMVFMNDKGFPEIRAMGKPIKSDQPSGLKVKFAVESKDFYEFKNEILKFFQGANLVPNILNCFEKEYLDSFSNHSEVVEKIGDIEILKKSRTCPRNELSYGCYARLGLVLYSFDASIFNTSQLNGFLNEGRYRLRICKDLGISINEYCDIVKKHDIGSYIVQFLRNVASYDSKYTIFNFKIGDLSVQASRERLSFDKQTTFAFNYFVLKHFVKIAYEAEKQLKQCKVFEDYLDVTTKMKNFQFQIPTKNICNYAWMSNGFNNIELNPAKMLGFLRQRYKGEIPQNMIFRKYIRCNDYRSSHSYSEAKIKGGIVFKDVINKLQPVSENSLRKFLPPQLTIYVGTASYCNILDSEEELGGTFLYAKISKKDNKERIIEVMKKSLPSFIEVEEIPESLDYVNIRTEKEKVKVGDYSCRIIESGYCGDSYNIEDFRLSEDEVNNPEGKFKSKKIYYVPFNKWGKELKARAFLVIRCAKRAEYLFELKVDQIKWLNSLGIETIDITKEEFNLPMLEKMVEHKRLFYSVVYDSSKCFLYEVKKIVNADEAKRIIEMESSWKPFVRDLYYGDINSGLGKRVKIRTFNRIKEFIEKCLPAMIVKEKLIASLIASKSTNQDYRVKEFYNSILGEQLTKLYSEILLGKSEEKSEGIEIL